LGPHLSTPLPDENHMTHILNGKFSSKLRIEDIVLLLSCYRWRDKHIFIRQRCAWNANLKNVARFPSHFALSCGKRNCTCCLLRPGIHFIRTELRR
jgi:hypothetical protein